MFVQDSFRASVIILTVILTTLIVAAPVVADDDFPESNTHTQARYQVGLKVAYRIDDTRYHDYTPSAGARFLYYPADWVAFIVGFHYNSHGELSDRVSYRSLVVDFSWRFQSRNELFLKSLPYLEIGQVTPRYWVTNNGREITETDGGWRVAAGFSIPLGKAKTVDFAVSQIFNHYENDIILASLPSADCPLGADCGYYRYVPDGVYNEANLEMTFRIGL